MTNIQTYLLTYLQLAAISCGEKCETNLMWVGDDYAGVAKRTRVMGLNLVGKNKYAVKLGELGFFRLLWK